MKSSSFLDWKRAKAARQRKSTKDKKERMLSLNSGCYCRREGWWRWRCRWMRTRCADHKCMWQRLCLRVKPQKRGLNRWPKAQTAGGGGPGSPPSTNHVIGKRTVNTTLMKGYHATTRRTARNLPTFSHTSSTPNSLYTIFFAWGRRL